MLAVTCVQGNALLRLVQIVDYVLCKEPNPADDLARIIKASVLEIAVDKQQMLKNMQTFRAKSGSNVWPKLTMRTIHLNWF